MRKKINLIGDNVLIPFQKLEKDRETVSSGFALTGNNSNSVHTKGWAWRYLITSKEEEALGAVDVLENQKTLIARQRLEVAQGHRGNGFGQALLAAATSCSLMDDHTYIAVLDVNEAPQLAVYSRYCRALLNPDNFARALKLEETRYVAQFEDGVVVPVYYCAEQRRQVIIARFAIELDYVISILADDVANLITQSRIETANISLARRLEDFSQKSHEYEDFLSEKRRTVSNNVIRSLWPIADVDLKTLKVKMKT